MKDLIRKTQEFKDLRAKAREAIAPLVANRVALAARTSTSPSTALRPSARR